MNNYLNIADKTIAVLPFVNMSADEENEYFSDGITEEIINALAKLGSLKVTSRTSSFFFKGKNIPIPEIGEKLGVSTILEGSVRLSGNAMRITAQLIDTKEDFHFWSETWDRELHNVFQVQDEISLLIADRLREHFGHFEIEEHLIDKKTGNINSYDLFLKGRFHMTKWNPESVKKSIDFYQEAIKVDAQNAEAMAGMADAYSFLATTGVISFEEGWGKSAQLTQEALRIDPKLPAAYYQLANLAFFTAFDYREAFNMATKAIALNPSHVESQQFLSFLHILSGKKEKAYEHLSITLRIDPLSQESKFYNAYFNYMFEDFPNALDLLDECLVFNPLNIPCHYVKTLCLIKLKEYDKVINYFDTLPTQVIVQAEKTGALTIAHTLKGNKKEAIHFKQDLEAQSKEKDGFTADSYLYLLYGATGNNDKAFEWVDKALKNGAPLLLLRYTDPIVSPIKNDPRYLEFHQKLFPEDLFKPKKENNTKKPLLDEAVAEDYKSRLQQLIKEDKPYLNSELSLRSLADLMDIHANQLSWLLNEGFGKNFNEFINSHRIEAFKEMATDSENAHLTIMSIAYDCGFNSKTVFNTYFKKETGLTPKQFLKG